MIDVNIQFARSRREPGAVAQVSLGGVLSQGLARVVGDRVKNQGRPARQPEPYATGKKRLVSPNYPLSGGGIGPSGAKVFRDSASMHSRMKRGSFDVTGGMWSGLTVVHRARHKATIKFWGRSQGQDPNFKTYKSGKQKGQTVAKGRMVNNALKAWTVFHMKGTNVLEPIPSEYEALSKAAAHMLSRSVERQLGVPIAWSRNSRPTGTARRIAHASRASRIFR